MLAVLVLAACLAPTERTEDSGSGGEGTGGSTWATPHTHFLDCGWDSGGFYLETQDSSAAGLALGIAQTGDCEDCWTGEDCLRGDLQADGSAAVRCHELGPHGGYLSTVDSVDQLVEGATTLHHAGQRLTYLLVDLTFGDCFILGADVAWYHRLGCHEVGGPCHGDAVSD